MLTTAFPHLYVWTTHVSLDRTHAPFFTTVEILPEACPHIMPGIAVPTTYITNKLRRTYTMLLLLTRLLCHGISPPLPGSSLSFL